MIGLCSEQCWPLHVSLGESVRENLRGPSQSEAWGEPSADRGRIALPVSMLYGLAHSRQKFGVYTEETLKDAYFPKRRGTRVTFYHKVGLVLENPSKEASNQEPLLPMTGSHFSLYVCKPSLDQCPLKKSFRNLLLWDEAHAVHSALREQASNVALPPPPSSTVWTAFPLGVVPSAQPSPPVD